MKSKAQAVSRASAPPWIRGEVDCYEVYLRAEKRSENTVRQYGETLERFLAWLDKRPADITKADMQRWKGHLAEGYCENTMSTRIAAVNQYMEKIQERVDLKIRPPRRVFRTKIPLTEDEIRRVLDEAKLPREGRKGFRNNSDMSKRDYAAICLMYYGGLRAGEVGSLRLSDLDLDNMKVRVHEGKGKDFSLVNLTDEAVGALREYLEHGRPKPMEREYADRVFLTQTGSPFSRHEIWPMVKRIAFRAGIEKNVHPHIFRHSMITHMAEKGLSASFIQAQSRHKSLDMVQRYTHLSQQSVRLAYDKAFSRKEPAEPENGAQKQSVPAEKVMTERADPRDRILESYLEGKISDGTLEKLLSMLDGQQVRGNAVSMNGYA